MKLSVTPSTFLLESVLCVFVEVYRFRGISVAQFNCFVFASFMFSFQLDAEPIISTVDNRETPFAQLIAVQFVSSFVLWCYDPVFSVSGSILALVPECGS